MAAWGSLYPSHYCVRQRISVEKGRVITLEVCVCMCVCVCVYAHANSAKGNHTKFMGNYYLIRGMNQEFFESCVFTMHVILLVQGTRYTNHTASLLLQATLLAGATILCRLVMPLLNAAFRRSEPSQILFSITSDFVASYYNQQCTFSCRVDFSTGTRIIITLQCKENHCSLGKFKSHITNQNSNFDTPKGASKIQNNSFNMEVILQKSRLFMLGHIFA